MEPPSASLDNEYDQFVDIYSVWTDTAASARANLAFYVDAYIETDGPVVELGVGDGRIALQAAARGRQVIGVDLSTAMLDRCRQRAAELGVSDKLALVQADFRHFQLDESAALIALPYHSLGHVTAIEEKRAVVERVFSQLRPGGRFLFDDFLMTPAAVDHMRAVQLRAKYQSASGADVRLWVTSIVDESAQSIRVVTWEDERSGDVWLPDTRYRYLTLSWLVPTQARQLLTDAGFLVDACYGDFEGTPFSESTAHEQVWVARRPA
jgi:ubiquinone/menaquinone biosynthesis C-methylase UbiE